MSSNARKASGGNAKRVIVRARGDVRLKLLRDAEEADMLREGTRD